MESNGPDVKVRGTAHQICEKYQALARDAHASGDRIAYENYLQHAEHYQRIILATQQVAQENAAQAKPPEAEKTDVEAEAAPEVEAKEVETKDVEASEEAEAPRRARRGRRTRSTRGNGKANGADDAAAGDAEAPVETA